MTDNFTIAALLNREPFPLPPSLARHFTDTTFLITGGGGSIGSELCRALSSFPCTIVAYDRSETNLTRLISESRDHRWRAVFKPFLGDVTQRPLLDYAMRCHRPSAVIHAAAYKHLPLLESFPLQAVENNVIGTRNVLQSAVRNGVYKFVLISTDKAVQPSSVMGCTKRLAEMVILDPDATASSHTRPVVVRLGNVLGSSGSVLPLFESQIAAGGPLTVTSPDATRFFMSIPDAANLILTAAAIDDSGATFVLDMGEPVNIYRLARRFADIRNRPDIPIVFTGLRPGEKLTEQLYTGETSPTGYERIWKVKNDIDWDLLDKGWTGLTLAVERCYRVEALNWMRKIVLEYQPPVQPESAVKDVKEPAAHA